MDSGPCRYYQMRTSCYLTCTCLSGRAIRRSKIVAHHPSPPHWPHSGDCAKALTANPARTANSASLVITTIPEQNETNSGSGAYMCMCRHNDGSMSASEMVILNARFFHDVLLLGRPDSMTR